MNPNRRVRRNGARPSFNRPRPSYSRRPTVRPATRRRGLRLSLPGLPQRGLPHLPAIKVSWLRLGAVGTLCIAVLVLAAHLTTLRQIKISGNRSVPTAQLTQLATAGLKHQWFGRNTLLIDGGALASYLQQSDPAIAQATVHRSTLHTLAITIKERQPTLNWKTDGIVYLLDANAIVIGPTTPTYAKLPVAIDSGNLPVKAGEKVAPTQFVTFCADLAQLLPTTGYQISALTVPASTNEVYVTTTTGLTLKFDTTRVAGDEIADLKAVQAELAASHQAPTQYIDLRIAHKAYYM